MEKFKPVSKIIEKENGISEEVTLCGNCKSELYDITKFCPECGEPIDWGE